MTLMKGRNLVLGYEDQVVVSDLSFEVESGDYICIVGENGSGKSTFVKTVLSLVEPLKGRIEYLNGLRKNEIGYLPQQSAIQRDFPCSVMEVVLSGCRSRHKGIIGYTKEEKEKAVRTLESLEMDGFVRSSYQELSGGQQQRVLLSRALMATEKVLLLDEPVTGLDPRTSSGFYRLVDNLNRDGLTIMMVTHDIHPALNEADSILHFSHNGCFFGSRDEYFSSDVGRRFLEEAGHHGHDR